LWQQRRAGGQYRVVTNSRVRIGCLGAAKIAPAALIKPAQRVQGAEVVAVAARNRDRADGFARRHSIPKVYGSYKELIEAPDIDAVYIPLPNGLHAEWTLAALDAGKHVLCEKPFTANAAEAEKVADASAKTDRVVMEAFHWRYHPLATRMLEVIESGDLGEIRHIEAALMFPLFKSTDIRWQLDLAGGSLMDAGCYPVNIVRTLAGAEPEVKSAAARVRSAGVDRWIQAELRFADGRTGRVTAGMLSSRVLRLHARVKGEKGEMFVFNPLAPHLFNLLSVRTNGRRTRQRVKGRPTYEYQLQAFVSAVRDGTPVLTDPAGAVANMRVIDAIYRAAGLELRVGSSERTA
jgi:predicted dehydrogenase